MTLKDKMELVRLLNLYQNDLLDANEANIKEAAKYERGDKWKGDYTFGIKAQFEHARCIAQRLSVEINKSLKSSWQMY